MYKQEIDNIRVGDTIYDNNYKKYVCIFIHRSENELLEDSYIYAIEEEEFNKLMQ